MATGDMPPGSRGNLFVHDPKIAGEKEVRGQIKLKFRDVTGNPVVVTRTLASEQKAKVVRTRTVEGNISREVHGKRQNLSLKCADVNREMISFLGVSKAVLDNVIFCHQEESNWPLSEGKVLKQKFDDIFAATRYIKALEAIRKFRQEQAQSVKEYAIELNHLKANKEKAEQITDELTEIQGKVSTTKDKIKELNEKLEPVQLKLTNLDSIAYGVDQLERKLESLSTERRQLSKVEADLKDKIINVFNGPVEELQKKRADFQEKVVEKENSLKRDEGKLQRLGQEQQSLSAKEIELHVEGGRLQREAHKHKVNVSDRDKAIVDLANEYNFKGFEKGPFSNDSDAVQFLEEMRRKYENVKHDTRHQRGVFEERLNKLQTKIDDMKKNQAQIEETIRLKNDFMGENQRKLKQIGQELSRINTSANRLKSLKGELQRAEEALDDAKEGGNLDVLGREIDQLQSEKRKIDNELRQLREEQQAMHMQSKTQAELDMKTKEKRTKENAIQQIMDQHEEDLETTLGTRGTTESLHTRLMEHLRVKLRELKETRNKLQNLKQQLSSKQTRKRMIAEDLNDKENLVQERRRQITEACDGNDYNTTRELIKNKIDSLQDKRGTIASLEKIYSKYVSKLESSEVHRNGCPLCHRTFNSNNEIAELVSELKNKIQNLPDRREANEGSLKKEQKRYDHILQLAPAKETLESLVKNEIPDAKSKLDAINSEEQTIKNRITELEDLLNITEKEEQIARQMEPDIRMLAKHKGDLRELDENISLLQSKMNGVARGRSMQSVSSEITEKQDKSEFLNTSIDRKRTQLNRLQQELNKLETNVHELKLQKLGLEAQLQTRTHLEQQKSELTTNNVAFEREIKAAETELTPLAAGLEELQDQKVAVTREKERADHENKKLLDRMRTSRDEVRMITDAINRYVTLGGDAALEDNKARLRELADRTDKLKREKDVISNKIDKLKKDIANQQISARELEDNIQLKSTQEEILNIETRMDAVNEELKQYGEHQDLVSESQVLQQTSEELRKEIAHYEGRLKGFEEDEERCQRELGSDLYRNADEKHRHQVIDIKTTEMANSDLDKYYKALDRAIMHYHGLKMADINKIIKEYWINTYKGNDIDTIEIRSDEEEGSGATKTRRTYNYRVVMIKGDTELDMRGRCSAGQKVLASIIIRLALAETFCLNCGILTLDEPTTNLDEDNNESLANQLASIIKTRQQQRNFQLVVITNDEEFVLKLGRADFVDYYFRINKDDSGYSKITRQSVVAEESLLD
ncbi:PREDICTED: DNA repair protein RAD50-like isoform X2 [Acropora digitifera]|nr:PREDICTED: DNA repair protein RAD50-like isoform X2 [Acropora digitifera]